MTANYLHNSSVFNLLSADTKSVAGTERPTILSRLFSLNYFKLFCLCIMLLMVSGNIQAQCGGDVEIDNES